MNNDYTVVYGMVKVLRRFASYKRNTGTTGDMNHVQSNYYIIEWSVLAYVFHDECVAQAAQHKCFASEKKLIATFR